MAFKELTSIQTPLYKISEVSASVGYTLQSADNNTRVKLVSPDDIVVFDSLQNETDGTRVGQTASPMRLYGTVLYWNDVPLSETIIGDIGTRLTKLETTVASIQTNISSINNSIAGLETSVSGNTKSIEDLQKEVQANQKSIQGHSTSITTIQSQIVELQKCCHSSGDVPGISAGEIEGYAGQIGECSENQSESVVTLKDSTGLQAGTRYYGLENFIESIDCYRNLIPTVQMVLDMIQEYTSGGYVPSVDNPHIVMDQNLYVTGDLVIHDSVMIAPSAEVSWNAERFLQQRPIVTSAKEDDIYYQDVEVLGDLYVMGKITRSDVQRTVIYQGDGKAPERPIEETDVEVKEIGEMLGKLVVRGKVYINGTTSIAQDERVRTILQADNISINNINDLYALLDARYLKNPTITRKIANVSTNSSGLTS